MNLPAWTLFEASFWLVAVLWGVPVALAILLALAGWRMVGHWRSYRGAAGDVLILIEAVGPELWVSSRGLQAILDGLARQAGVFAPPVVVDDRLKPHSAVTNLGADGDLIRVSSSLAADDPRTLRVILAHELGHTVRRPGFISRLARSSATLLLLAGYTGLVMWLPVLLIVPKSLLFIAGDLADEIGGVLVSERSADRFALTLTGDPVTLLKYLESDGVASPLTRRIHMSRRAALRRAMKVSGHPRLDLSNARSPQISPDCLRRPFRSVGSGSALGTHRHGTDPGRSSRSAESPSRIARTHGRVAGVRANPDAPPRHGRALLTRFGEA